jgi:predicted chitinase
MSTILTREQLKQMVKNPHIDHWYDALEQLLDDYEINTPQRVAAFIAQCAHESGNFAFIKENLNYKAASLRKVFPKYFPTDALAAQYANKPEKIANRVYASRMGNGDEASSTAVVDLYSSQAKTTTRSLQVAWVSQKKKPLSTWPHLKVPHNQPAGSGNKTI